MDHSKIMHVTFIFHKNYYFKAGILVHYVPINAEVKLSNLGSSSVYYYSFTGPESLDSPIEFVLQKMLIPKFS